MVRMALICLLLTALPAQAAQWMASLSHREIRLGEPVMLHLEARGKDISLDHIDLAELTSAFEVFSITRSGTTQRARLDATLYPLRVGTLTVPALPLQGLRSKALELRVTDDPDLNLTAAFTPNVLFERQQSSLLISIRDRADRSWPTPAKPDPAHLLLRPLGERQYEDDSGEQRVKVHEFRWEALALKAGHHALKLPMLDVFQLGRRLRFPVPIAHLQVRALPSYLPVSVPVGMPKLSLESLQSEGKVGQALIWVLRVEAAGFSADAARELLHLPLGEHSGLRFYPARFQQEQPSGQAAPVLRIEIPVVPTQAGSAKLPDVVLPYFNPLTMRMEHAKASGASLAVIDPLHRQVLGMAGFVLLLVATGFVLYRARRRWERLQARRMALQRILEGKSSGELVEAICAFSTSPHPLTLRQWLDRLPRKQGLQPLLEELEMAHFGAVEHSNLDSLKQRWLAALSRQPII